MNRVFPTDTGMPPMLVEDASIVNLKRLNLKQQPGSVLANSAPWRGLESTAHRGGAGKTSGSFVKNTAKGLLSGNSCFARNALANDAWARRFHFDSHARHVMQSALLKKNYRAGRIPSFIWLASPMACAMLPAGRRGPYPESEQIGHPQMIFERVSGARFWLMH